MAETDAGTVASTVERSTPVASAQSTVMTPVAILVRLAIGRFTTELEAMMTFPE